MQTQAPAADCWTGECVIAVRGRVLEVRDNGMRMTVDGNAHCLASHFTTKRDNPLYEGYSAGRGLGLSFVAMVPQRHGATLVIETAPTAGAVFRITFAETT